MQAFTSNSFRQYRDPNRNGEYIKDNSHWINYGVKLKEKSDSVGHECHLLIPGVSKSDKYASVEAFLIAKLLGK